LRPSGDQLGSLPGTSGVSDPVLGSTMSMTPFAADPTPTASRVPVGDQLTPVE
jgi:hypothetical protein